MSEALVAKQVNYATTVLSLLILVSRNVLSLLRRERIDLSFTLVSASVVAVTARIILNEYYLDLGNAADAAKQGGSLPPDKLHQVETGSILVLAARALITVVLWLQISILLVFYTRITAGINWVAVMIKFTWASVLATLIAIELVTFLECRPITLYWQVSPPPGTCVQAYGQLYTQTISNIILDLMLIVIAWPIIKLRKRTIAEHVTLYTLFILGTFCIIISIIRIVSVRDHQSAQSTRSLWASVQMLVSTFVANAPNIYGSIRDLRRRKMTGHSSNTAEGNNKRRSGYHRQTQRDSWIRMDDELLEFASPSSPSYMLKPLPPATTFYDDATAPSPFSHHSSVDDLSLNRDEVLKANRSIC
ncbi:hypothetical protein GGR57DRAFT_503169 [Xylariaceae sp. FL1272]|nr:hypothetical protein GGR57DRAFT_503169 [Xylariaceae sp. FL1272]